MKPIETLYKGIIFRSFLEAKWAVFFDTINLAFVYEPAKFETTMGAYCPDFYMPELDVWIEIKPLTAPGPKPEEIAKLKVVLARERKYGLMICGFPSVGQDPLVLVFSPLGQIRSYGWSEICNAISPDYSELLFLASASVQGKSGLLSIYRLSAVGLVVKALVYVGLLDRYEYHDDLQNGQKLMDPRFEFSEQFIARARPVKESLVKFFNLSGVC